MAGLVPQKIRHQRFRHHAPVAGGNDFIQNQKVCFGCCGGDLPEQGGVVLPGLNTLLRGHGVVKALYRLGVDGPDTRQTFQGFYLGGTAILKKLGKDHPFARTGGPNRQTNRGRGFSFSITAVKMNQASHVKPPGSERGKPNPCPAPAGRRPPGYHTAAPCIRWHRRFPARKNPVPFGRRPLSE